MAMKVMNDRELGDLVTEEEKRQEETLDLIPSENVVSQSVLRALGSRLMNKYSEGYPGKRYYAGNAIVDKIELLAQRRARKVFRLPGRWHVNVQPYSGSPANMAVYYGLLEPGDTIMGMSLPFGGHLTHGWKVNFSSRFYRSVQYTVTRNGRIDYESVAKLARREKPRLIVAGATAYPRFFDFEKFSHIARDVGAYFMADIAHVAGLIVAGVHPSPFPYADVVTTTTHKTLRGPRGAIIFANKESKVAARHNLDIASAIDRAVFPALQGGPHDNQTAAIAAALGEALRPTFKTYGRQVVENATALARALKKRKFRLVSGGTDNHMILVDLTNVKVSGREAQDRLEAAGIITNRNAIPYDTRSPFDPSGIRIGTPAITSRGLAPRDMSRVADWISRVVVKKEKPETIRREVKAFLQKYAAF
ncbi:MAG: serine hydroxymethyltransferase [Candidatus Sungbacteria bacterium]|nr:serine hydroxymethyltransferase [Candidatus Sungbacteria bacterium]